MTSKASWPGILLKFSIEEPSLKVLSPVVHACEHATSDAATVSDLTQQSELLSYESKKYSDMTAKLKVIERSALAKNMLALMQWMICAVAVYGNDAQDDSSDCGLLDCVLVNVLLYLVINYIVSWI